MKLTRFQQGGITPILLDYTPVVSSYSRASDADSSSASVASTKKEDKSDGITDKDLLKALDSLDALPNEVRAIQTELQNFILDQSALGGLDSTTISMKYASLIGKMKIAKFNSDQYKEAYNQIKSNGGINEIAIDTDGYIYCRNRQDPNDFERFTAQEYLQNYNDYRAVSNQELLELRARSPELIDNNEVLKVVANGMGMPAIQTMINNAITKIGTTTMQQGGYSQIQINQIQQGVENIQEASENSGSEGTSTGIIQKLEVMSKDQQQQAKMALQYVYSTLPKSARALLEVKAVEGGVQGGVLGLLSTLISSKLDFTKTEDEQRSKDPSSKGTKSTSTAVPKGVDPTLASLQLTPVMMTQLGMGERKQIATIHGGKYGAKNYAQVVPIVNKEGAALGAATTLAKVSESQLSGMLSWEDATMGGARIDQTAMMKVAITGGKMYVMNIPIDKSRNDGVIAPDIRYLRRLEDADQDIEVWKRQNRGKEITPKEINEIYKKHQLPVLMDEYGNINARDYAKFALFNGITKDCYLIPPPDGTDIVAEDVSKSAESYKNILLSTDPSNKEDFDEDNLWDWNGHDTLYKATVFIPVSTNILSGAATSGQKITGADAVEIEARNQQKERLKNYDPSGASKFE